MAYRKIDTANYAQHGEGASAIVYIDESRPFEIIKVFNKDVLFSEIEKEYNRSLNITKLGLPSPKALELVDFDGRIGIVYERVMNKISVSRAIVNDYENIDKYMKIFAENAKKLHATKADVSFPKIKDFYHSLIDRADYLTSEQMKKVHEQLDKVEDKDTVIHGDMHTGNMILCGDQPYWIDLGAVSQGNPVFDLAAYYFLMNVACYAPFAQNNFHMNPEQMQNCWKKFCKYYYGDDSEAFLKNIGIQLAPMSIFFPVFGYVIMGIKVPQDIKYVTSIIDSL